MKKFFAYAIIFVFHYIPGIICGILNVFSQNNMIIGIISLILTVALCILFANLTFKVSQNLSPSVKGLRYKVYSIYTILLGFTTGINAFTSVYKDAELIDIFTHPNMLGLFLVSLVNTAFIFGVSLFTIYKMNYKKDLINKL